ncbi:MAG: hypothetical protein J7621_10065 [Niastella sp.]|nr:hypothetical protein [Niastella sp.]
MNRQLFFRWFPLLCLILVIAAGISLGQKNSKLVTRNHSLVLQNDSILAVNLRLSKEVSKLQSLLDSIRLKNSSAGSLRIHN